MHLTHVPTRSLSPPPFPPAHVRLRAVHVALVQYRHNCQVLLKCEEKVGHRLGLREWGHRRESGWAITVWARQSGPQLPRTAGVSMGAGVGMGGWSKAATGRSSHCTARPAALAGKSNDERELLPPLGPRACSPWLVCARSLRQEGGKAKLEDRLFERNTVRTCTPWLASTSSSAPWHAARERETCSIAVARRHRLGRPRHTEQQRAAHLLRRDMQQAHQLRLGGPERRPALPSLACLARKAAQARAA